MNSATVTIHPTEATPQAEDKLAITGTVLVTFGDASYFCQVSAQGWVSATQNHYPPEAFGEDGHRLGHWENEKGENVGADSAPPEAGGQWVEDVPPRPMTQDEITSYCTQLLLEAFVASTPLTQVHGQNLLTA